MKYIADNHSHGTVPVDEAVSGVRIATVITGVAITLPAFLLGSKIIGDLGLVDGVIAMFLGGLFLAVIGIFCMLVGSQSKLSTYTILQFCFGRLGSKIINIVLSVTLFGWYGVTVVIFGEAMAEVVSQVFSISISWRVFTVFGSVLMIFTGIFGFRAIERLSFIVVPLLLTVLSFGVYKVVEGTAFSEMLEFSGSANNDISTIGQGCALFIGGFMIGVTISPDLSRFARFDRDAFWGALLSFGIGTPVVMILAGLPSIVSSEPNLVLSMTAVGLGVPALGVMVFASWTTNVNTLYSTSLSVAQLLPNAKDWFLTLLAGIVGTILALAGIMEHFVDFLIMIGIIIPPIAGVYLAEYFLIKPNKIDIIKIDDVPNYRLAAIFSWGIASLIGFVETQYDWSLLGVQSVDTIALSMIILLVLKKVTQLKGQYVNRAL